MRFIHLECGGEVDSGDRTCSRCGYHWNIISFLLSRNLRVLPGGGSSVDDRIHKKEERKARLAKKFQGRGDTDYALWADKYLGVGWVASRLPKWPRWVRISVTVAFYSLVIWIAIIVFRSCY